jgi:type IV pilus assembly protein PilW
MLVIMQTLSVFEFQKRSTTAGSDAQVNGLMALLSMEQSIRSAGAGFANTAAFACSTIYAWYDNGTTNGPLSFSFSPITITSGGLTGSDTITVQSGKNFLGNIPVTITTAMPSSSSELNVSQTIGFTANDLVLVANGTGCTLMQLTTIQPTALKLQHNPGGSTGYNPSVPYQTSNSWPAYGANSQIINIGQINMSTYSISSTNRLQVKSSQLGVSGSNQVELATDIVSFKAQYGIAATGSQNVTKWVNADSSSGTNWATPTGIQVKMIKAVRLVIVSRSAKKETQDVTFDCTNTGSGTVNHGPCAWTDTAADPAPKIDLSFLPGGVTANPDWAKYRYKVYSTVIPLRNVIWANI